MHSSSDCLSYILYIKYFYKAYYAHDYKDGFQENLMRMDLEKYVQWVVEDYKSQNATFRIKVVSFIRNWLDFI